jgi:hypothetical protein
MLEGTAVFTLWRFPFMDHSRFAAYKGSIPPAAISKCLQEETLINAELRDIAEQFDLKMNLSGY